MLMISGVGMLAPRDLEAVYFTNECAESGSGGRGA
jgi:hypothetical protein